MISIVPDTDGPEHISVADIARLFRGKVITLLASFASIVLSFFGFSSKYYNQRLHPLIYNSISLIFYRSLPSFPFLHSIPISGTKKVCHSLFPTPFSFNIRNA